MAGGGKRFDWLRDILAEEHNLITTDLKSGQVPEQTDLLLLASPDKLDDRQLFAVDQFLMRGGTLVIATAPFDIDAWGALSVSKQDSGLSDWLAHHGITLEAQMVLDPRNAAFPIPVDRQLGAFVVRETRMVDYPYFVDVRGDGIEQQSGMTAGIDQVTLTWASPIVLDSAKNQGRKVVRLLESSDRAWTSDSLDIQPDYGVHGQLGFPAGPVQGAQLLAAALEGRFDSFFRDKPSPLAAREQEADSEDKPAQDGEVGDAEAQSEEKQEPVITRVIDRSPESARIILFASNSFITDEMLSLATSGLGTRYLKPVQLLENAIDWSLEDRGLLTIRGRAQFSRTLNPLGRESQMFWEYLNYGLALFGLVLIWWMRRRIDNRAQMRYAALLGAAR